MTNDRGVLYLKWGNQYDHYLQRSIESVMRHHPELAIHIHEAPPDSNMLIKASMFDYSPFETTLYLDTDTVVLDRLDYAFCKAKKFGLACCICENPSARRHRGLWNAGDMIEYQAGVMWFSRAVKPLFDRYKEIAKTLDSTTRVIMMNNTVQEQKYDDQAALAKAVEETGFHPFVLPLNYNYRPAFHKVFFGPVKICHAYLTPPLEILKWNEEQNRGGCIIHHASLDDPGNVRK